MFLALDGIDGTGKSTQVMLLAQRLRATGRSVTTCVDPGGTDLGAKLRAILLDGRQTEMSLRTEALLFLASRAELVHLVIAPALGRGEIVISDRFTMANLVYQAHAGGLDRNDLVRIGEFASGGLTPDLYFILDLPVEVAIARRGRSADRMESRDREYFDRVRQGFLAEAQRDPERVRVVEASPDVDAVHAAIWNLLQNHLG